MQDCDILRMYLERDEEAIEQTEKKYGRYCASISYGIVRSRDVAEECVNDAYLGAWNSIPPARPQRLSTYLGKLVRNISINRLLHDRRCKRYSEGVLVLEELAEILPGDSELDDGIALRDALNEFLDSLPELVRIVFVKRYWYTHSIREIARSLELTESNVKVTLMRTRNQLSKFLIDRGLEL